MKYPPIPFFVIYAGYVALEAATFYLDPDIKVAWRIALYSVMFFFIIKRSKGAACVAGVLHLLGGIICLAGAVEMMSMPIARFRIGFLVVFGVFQLGAAIYLLASKNLKAYQTATDDSARQAWLQRLGL